MPNVIPLPRRDVLERLPKDNNYLVQHEEKTDLSLPSQAGRRVVQVKKTFFDGHNRVEFSLEKEVNAHDDVDACLADLESAVTRFFA